jgi:hypothetical protein
VTFNAARAIRQSTKEKTVDSDVARRKAFKIKIKSRPPLKHQFSQKELLLDALETEVTFEVISCKRQYLMNKSSHELDCKCDCSYNILN